MKAKPEKISIAFKYPLAPEEMRSPERIDVPIQLYEPGPIELGEWVFLQYLIKETYAEHRLEFRTSYSELKNGAKLLYDRRPGGRRFCARNLTKPKITKALKKFEKLGFISVKQS